MPERQQRYRQQLDVLLGKRQPDDGDGIHRRQDQVHDRKLQPRQNNPDDIHEQPYGPGRRLGLTDFAAEWCQNAARQLKTLKTEGDADDRKAQEDAAYDVAEHDQESAKDEEEQVA